MANLCFRNLFFLLFVFNKKRWQNTSSLQHKIKTHVVVPTFSIITYLSLLFIHSITILFFWSFNSKLNLFLSNYLQDPSSNKNLLQFPLSLSVILGLNLQLEYFSSEIWCFDNLVISIIFLAKSNFLNLSFGRISCYFVFSSVIM